MKSLKVIAALVLVTGLSACVEHKDPEVVAVPVATPPTTVVVPADPQPSTVIVPGPAGPPGPQGEPGMEGAKGDAGNNGDTVIIETEKTITDNNNDGIDDKDQ